MRAGEKKGWLDTRLKTRRGKYSGGSQKDRAVAKTEVTKEELENVEGIEDSELLVLTRGPRSGMNYEKDTFRLKNPLIPYDD